jgi:hypothetical protein
MPKANAVEASVSVVFVVDGQGFIRAAQPVDRENADQQKLLISKRVAESEAALTLVKAQAQA